MNMPRMNDEKWIMRDISGQIGILGGQSDEEACVHENEKVCGLVEYSGLKLESRKICQTFQAGRNYRRALVSELVFMTKFKII